MATTTFDKFFPYIQPYVPECPEFVIETHVAEAAAKFCRETYIWRVDLDEDVTVAGEAIYDVDVPSGTVLEDILFFEVDGSPITRVSDRHVAPTLFNEQGIPQWYDVYLDTQVRVFPTPDDSYTFRATAVVKPKLDSGGVETFIYETFGRCIANGAIAQLTAIPGKAWSDPALSAAYSMKFSQSIAKARIRDFKSVPLRVRPQPFA